MKNKENNGIKQIILLLSMAGILILLILSNFQKPKSVQITDISEKNLNEKVLVQGKIKIINELDQITIIKLQDNFQNSIDVICNCKNFKRYLNKTVEVYGRVEKYKNTIQINSDIIRLK
ncbi:MAG: hypothetical protein AABX03_00360 [Nanoarchaeota archaeon]